MGWQVGKAVPAWDPPPPQEGAEIECSYEHSMTIGGFEIQVRGTFTGGCKVPVGACLLTIECIELVDRDYLQDFTDAIREAFITLTDSQLEDEAMDAAHDWYVHHG